MLDLTSTDGVVEIMAYVVRICSYGLQAATVVVSVEVKVELCEQVRTRM